MVHRIIASCDLLSIFVYRSLITTDFGETLNSEGFYEKLGPKNQV